MSDFEMFEGEMVNHVSAEEDPAADFLAREQDELAGLEDDTLGLNTGSNPAPTEFSNGITETYGSQNSLHEQLNGPSEGVPQRPAVQREEPQKIKLWREEQQKMLQVKDAEEEQKKLELQEGAKKELEDWYNRYREQIEKAKLNNREESKSAEQEWVAERDAESPGQEWERIARLCDFNPKASRSTKDTSRMRSIILQLKQAPLNAKA